MVTCPKCGSGNPKERWCMSWHWRKFVKHKVVNLRCVACDNSDFHDPVSERPTTVTPVGTCNRIDEERHKGLHFKIYDTNQSGPPFPCLNFVVASVLPVEAPSQCQITVQDVVWLVRHKLTVGPVLLPAFRECARERITECLDALQQIQQDGWKRPSWVDSTRASVVEAQRDRDAELLRVVDDSESVYYGPYACETCQRIICRVSLEQGGMKFDYPHGIIYPNTNWVQHVCPDLTVTERPVVVAPREATPPAPLSEEMERKEFERTIVAMSDWDEINRIRLLREPMNHLIYKDPFVQVRWEGWWARAASSTPQTTRIISLVDILLETLRSDRLFLKRYLDQLVHISTRDDKGNIVNGFAAAQIPDWTLRQRIDDIEAGLARAASSTLQTTPEYPKPCGICNGVIESKDDLDWHGYGNCRDIPDIVMADLNIAELLRDLQGHVAGELGERLDKAVNGLAAPNAPSHNAGEN